MMMATRTRIEQEPNYTYVTARLLRDELVATGLAFWDCLKIHRKVKRLKLS